MADNTMTTDELFATVYGLWTKWCNSLETQSKEDIEENRQLVRRFMVRQGAKDENSPACLMFAAFIAGINEGIDYATFMGEAEAAKEEDPASGQDRQGQ